LIFQAMDGGQAALWRWWPGTQQPVKIGRSAGQGFAEGQPVAFSADGTRVVFASEGGAGPEAVWFDIKTQTRLDALKLEGQGCDLTTLGDGRVAISMGDHVLLWRPEASWYQAG
jgi:hypothetical protein